MSRYAVRVLHTGYPDIWRENLMCWTCHWGVPSSVAGIYLEALRKLNGNEMPLLFGPAHIVWEDYNLDSDSIQWCLDNFERYTENYTNEEMKVVRWSLEKLLELGDNIVDVCPTNYDWENPDPEKFPPPDGIEMVKI